MEFKHKTTGEVYESRPAKVIRGEPQCDGCAGEKCPRLCNELPDCMPTEHGKGFVWVPKGKAGKT